MTESLVTVIVPTYNRSWGLRRAVESVLVQTFPNFQLLIVDDASTDETEQVARWLPPPSPRCRP